MKLRLPCFDLSPEALAGLRAVGSYLQNSSLGSSLIELIFSATATIAKPAFSDSDFSGVYDCIGIDDHEGKYTGTVTLEFVPAQSFDRYGAYNFKLEVPGYGAYLGEAAARSNDMAIHFALADQSTKDYGTGIASFKKTKPASGHSKSTTTSQSSRAVIMELKSARNAKSV